MVQVKPKGGLCNKLRVVFSYYEYALSINSDLNVIWGKSNACPGYFLDYFDPIPRVHFVKSEKKVDYVGCQWHPNFNPYRKYIYDKLRLKPELEKIIYDKINILNKNYISVHIRRTDHVGFAKKKNIYTTDEEFINFIDKYDSDKMIYISTDNKNTYEKFKKKYPKRIIFDYHQTNDNSLRKTSLKDAIIDIYMCVHSNDFMGSSYSSFSDFIKHLRKNRN